MSFIPTYVPRKRDFTKDELENLLTMTEVSVFIQRGLLTISRWYRWYYNDDFPKPARTPVLPPIYQEKPNRQNFWHKDDLGQLIRFRNFVRRTQPMGDFSATQWPEGYRRKSVRKSTKKPKVNVTDAEVFAKIDPKKKNHLDKTSRAEIEE